MCARIGSWAGRIGRRRAGKRSSMATPARARPRELLRPRSRGKDRARAQAGQDRVPLPDDDLVAEPVRGHRRETLGVLGCGTKRSRTLRGQRHEARCGDDLPFVGFGLCAHRTAVDGRVKPLDVRAVLHGDGGGRRGERGSTAVRPGATRGGSRWRVEAWT
jgi:hypothetical protein